MLRLFLVHSQFSVTFHNLPKWLSKMIQRYTNLNSCYKPAPSSYRPIYDFQCSWLLLSPKRARNQITIKKLFRMSFPVRWVRFYSLKFLAATRFVHFSTTSFTIIKSGNDANVKVRNFFYSFFFHVFKRQLWNTSTIKDVGKSSKNNYNFFFLFVYFSLFHFDSANY